MQAPPGRLDARPLLFSQRRAHLLTSLTVSTWYRPSRSIVNQGLSILVESAHVAGLLSSASFHCVLPVAGGTPIDILIAVSFMMG